MKINQEIDSRQPSELMRLPQLKALNSAVGSWKDADHPELKRGSVNWVKELRQEQERHFEKALAK